MANIAQLVRAPDCGPGGRRFNSAYSPQIKYSVEIPSIFVVINIRFRGLFRY